MAFARAIVKVSARTRIHRARQHEPRRESEGHSGAGNTNRAVFQRLAHYFQHIAWKLGHLVQKKHAVVGERNFSGTRHSAASDQSSVRNSVMWGAKRTHSHQASSGVEHSGNAMYFRGLQRLFKSKWRQDGWHALSQHGFSRAGRTDHQNIVPTSACDFESALSGVLAAHIFEVHNKVLRFG